MTRLGVDATKKANFYANYVYSNNQHVHLKPRYSLLEIQCKPVDGFSVLNFWCVLQKFGMLLKHWITQEEIVIGNDDAHSIYLYGFMNVHQCSSHGLLFDEK